MNVKGRHNVQYGLVLYTSWSLQLKVENLISSQTIPLGTDVYFIRCKVGPLQKLRLHIRHSLQTDITRNSLT